MEIAEKILRLERELAKELNSYYPSGRRKPAKRLKILAFAGMFIGFLIGMAIQIYLWFKVINSPPVGFYKFSGRSVLSILLLAMMIGTFLGALMEKLISRKSM